MGVSNAEFKRVCQRAVKELRSFAPYDTGNLALNAIRMEMPSPDVCLIYVDERIAPYMPYTNEPWMHKKWHGKKNPNEGWWQKACDVVINNVAQQLDGEIE